MELMTAIHLFESLRLWVVSLRQQLNNSETSANVPCVCMSYKDELLRVKKCKVFLDKSTEHEVPLKGQEQYQVESSMSLFTSLSAV